MGSPPTLLRRVKGPDKQLQSLRVQSVSVNFLNALYLPGFFPFSPEIVESAGQP